MRSLSRNARQILLWIFMPRKVLFDHCQKLRPRGDLAELITKYPRARFARGVVAGEFAHEERALFFAEAAAAEFVVPEQALALLF